MQRGRYFTFKTNIMFNSCIKNIGYAQGAVIVASGGWLAAIGPNCTSQRIATWPP